MARQRHNLSEDKSISELGLYDKFLRFNRRLLSILKVLRPPLTTNESHALAAIANHPGILAKEISERLRLEKSTLSRVLHQLIKKAFITEIAAENDRRRKHLNLTELGVQILRTDSQVRNREVEAALAPLSAGEQHELCRLLAHMADTLGQPPVDQNPEDHPLKREIRRLTRGMGFIGTSCMGTGHPVEECQVLHYLSQHDRPILFSEFLKKFPYEVSAFSRLVSDLTARRLVLKTRVSGDQRSLYLSPTRHGREIAVSALRTGHEFVLQSLTPLPRSDAQRLADLIEKFVRNDFEVREILAQGNILGRVLEGTAEHARYRALLIEELVRTNRHHQIPERILSENSLCIAVERDGEPLCAAEIELRGKLGFLRQLVFFPFALRSNSETTDAARALLQTISETGRCSTLDSPAALLAPHLPPHIALTPRAAGLLRLEISTFQTI